MVKKYRVALSGEEQEEMKALVSKSRVPAYRQTHARILLLRDENQAGNQAPGCWTAAGCRIKG